MYVIRRNDGAYVAKSGSKSSYTRILEHARIFHSYSEAENELCPGNETIVSINDILR